MGLFSWFSNLFNDDPIDNGFLNQDHKLKP